MSTATQTQLPAATWGTDPVHSTAGFSIKYMVSTFRAGFAKLDVTLDTTGATPVLTGSVDPTSIDVKDENFHAHLQSPDFFDSERHPAITFESTGWRTDGDDARRRRQADDQGRRPPGRGARRPRRPARGPVGQHPPRHHARGERRPLALRHHLEQPAAQGRPRAGQRREARTSTSSWSRRNEGPGDLGQPAPGLPQHEAPPGGRRHAAARGRAGAVGGPQGSAALRRRRRHGERAWSLSVARRRDPRRRCGPVRHARVQPLGARASSRTRWTGSRAR